MVDTNALKAEIVRNGLKIGDVYSGIGLSKMQWYRRINDKKFDSDEMMKLTSLLNIEDPVRIFFAKNVD